MPVEVDAYDRLTRAVEHAGGRRLSTRELRTLPMAEPSRLNEALAGVMPARFVLTGTQDRRLILAEHAGGRLWTAAELNGASLGSRTWPRWTRRTLRLASPDSWLSGAELTAAGVQRLIRPTVLLVALYHSEWFPLPRFPLGISDLARAARATLIGQVRLMDMQLGVTMDDIHSIVAQWKPDVVGVSATFGQHDLTEELLDHLFARTPEPVVIAGGSLTARNEQSLLAQYPRLLVARGAGEPTLQDVLAYWHGDLDLDQIRGIGYTSGLDGRDRPARRAAFRRTATVTNRDQTDILPELDLLGETFTHRGVAQLETSRGCTNACSFCPRSHKGSWSGVEVGALPAILTSMREVFDRHPHISRTLYLVDEEFIGRGPGADRRALAVAGTIHRAGFRWESSCRVDQIASPHHDLVWHRHRAMMFRRLRRLGLRRMLFGVESGVTSILDRFNKETTGEQNALAIRTLSALGVPTRFTYITFDHLMSAAELRATYEFQGRTDLLLTPLPELSAEEIVDGVRDREFVARYSTGAPFYSAISYLLVSMECLIGAAYTRRVAAAGLAGPTRRSMGRVDANFADWRIGRCSHHAQLWVDRNFRLDYTLKSLEKILDGAVRHTVRNLRVVLKNAAYDVLGRMLRLVEQYPRHAETPAEFDDELSSVLDGVFEALRGRMSDAVDLVVTELPAESARLLRSEHLRWRDTTEWQLINAADPCGT
jgi:hypothetical protein